MTTDARPAQSPEPGAKHDHLSRFGFGPGVTPVDDLTTTAFFIVGAVAMGIFGALPELQGAGAWIFWLCALGFVAGAVYTTQRGIRRWRWRLANVHQTGGVYLRPWEKSPARPAADAAPHV